MRRRCGPALCALVALGCALAAALAQPAGASWNPPLLPVIAGELAGRPVDVRCLDRFEWKSLVTARGPQPAPGVADSEAGVIEMRRVVCEVLLGFAVAMPNGPRTRSRPGFMVTDYARLLARLSARVRGVSDPAEAECAALVSLQTVLERLGAEPSYARKLGGWLLDRSAARGVLGPLPTACPVQGPA